MEGFIFKKTWWDAIKNEGDWIIADVIRGLAAGKFGEEQPTIGSYSQLALNFIKADELADEEAAAKNGEK